jgi:hypothetical protein
MVSGLVSDVVQQSPTFRKGGPFSLQRLAFDVAVGGLSGTEAIPSFPAPGITTGRNSYLAVTEQVVTKFRTRAIQNVTYGTVGKIFVAQSYRSLAGAWLANALSGLWTIHQYAH